MSSRYKVGDTVEVWSKRLTIGERRRLVLFSRGIGTVIEIRGGGYYADYTDRRTYIVQLSHGVWTCFASELRLVKRRAGIERR